MVYKILLLSILIFPSLSKPDCVYNAKEKTKYQILSTGYGGKILFSGGYGNDFIVEVDGYVYSNVDSVMILKDDFCSWESNAIYIDEEVFDVKSVTKI